MPVAADAVQRPQDSIICETSTAFLIIKVGSSILIRIPPRPMIDLSKNENPTPVSSDVMRAIGGRLGDIGRYPVSIGEEAHHAAARCFGVDRSEIALTRGVDGALDELISHFGNRRFFVVTPGFNGFVERLAANRIVPTKLTLDHDFRLTDTQLQKLDRNCVVFVASPNNPTGRRFSIDELDGLAARCHGLLVDQTYDDFATKPVELPDMRQNFFRFRSFSKGYGLAGLRIGALIGMSDDIARIRRRQQYCHMDTLAGQAVIAVSDQTEFQKSVASTLRRRQALADDLGKAGFAVVAGDGNFVLVRHAAATQLTESLKTAGILVKDTQALGLSGHIRISVGTDRDHAALIAAMGASIEGMTNADHDT